MSTSLAGREPNGRRCYLVDMHPLLLHNGEIRSTADRMMSPGQVGVLNGWGVFSTLRVIHGVLFAYPRHWARMQRDARLLNVPMPPDAADLEAQLYRLIEANAAYDATLRVAIVRNTGGMFDAPNLDRDYDVVAFTKDLKDWGTGARLELAPATRDSAHEFRGTKMLSWSFNLILLERANRRGFDEIVMLNERGEVSECTSANLFAVFGSEVVTPPLDSGCLPGVTRAILLEEIRVPGLTITERTLKPADLERADEVFMTSSTRDVLPVASIAGLALKTGPKPVQAKLLSAFRDYLTTYAAAHARPIEEARA